MRYHNRLFPSVIFIFSKTKAWTWIQSKQLGTFTKFYFHWKSFPSSFSVCSIYLTRLSSKSIHSDSSFYLSLSLHLVNFLCENQFDPSFRSDWSEITTRCCSSRKTTSLLRIQWWSSNHVAPQTPSFSSVFFLTSKHFVYLQMSRAGREQRG